MADRIGGLVTWRELCEKAEAERDSLRRQVAAMAKQAEAELADAYQRGMVAGARQVLAAAEPLIEEIRAGGVFQRRAWPTEVCDDILATVREAVAEIENRKAAK